MSDSENAQPLAISGTLYTATPAPEYPPFPALHVQAAKLAVQLEAANPPSFHATLIERTEMALRSADLIYAWLATPGPATHLTFTFGPITDRATGQVITQTPGDNTMANTEIGDLQQSTATAVPRDADQQPTTDTLVWAASDTTAVTLTPSADTLSCVVAGAVPAQGVIITATDSAGNTTSGEVDIVAGPATSLSLSFGPVTDQAPAAPSDPSDPTAPTDPTEPAAPSA